ncbi:MAG: hypothetical protein O3B13_21285 [Planctomycetota bacterium]|nr:hypothetical protein [Planctomycetota bacterium]
MSDQLDEQLSRRACLKSTAASASALVTADIFSSVVLGNSPTQPVKPKSVAAVVTVYGPRSHADVIVGKILEGWKQEGGPGPALKLASLYVEQFPSDDLSRTLAKKHDVPMFKSIEQAVTVGGNSIPIDGVISIAEHGDYPWNDVGQHLYPRRRFFQEITDTFRKYDRVVPVFSDKHPGPVWKDAKWMYDRAREMKVPFMAGSSLPVSFRKPDIAVPMGSEIKAAVGIGYDGLDIYGSHALDSYQCIIERRRGANTAVSSVQFVEGDAVWKILDDGIVSRSLFDAAMSVLPRAKGNVSNLQAPNEGLILFECEDGFRGFQFMLQSVNRTAVAVQLSGQSRPMAMQFEERTEPRHPHFAYLLKGIEQMMHTGRPAYPAERSVLTSGILDRAIQSRAQGGRKLATPELAIQYQPVDYPHAPHPNLTSRPDRA